VCETAGFSRSPRTTPRSAPLPAEEDRGGRTLATQRGLAHDPARLISKPYDARGAAGFGDGGGGVRHHRTSVVDVDAVLAVELRWRVACTARGLGESCCGRVRRA
jgi:hypothetical protein